MSFCFCIKELSPYFSSFEGAMSLKNYCDLGFYWMAIFKQEIHTEK